MSVDGAPVGYGVIAARSMVATRAVLPAIDASVHARLVAVASRSGPVPVPWSSHDVGGYDDVIDHPDVEAVYVPLPNGMHRDWVERAARAGKHVLCEKPLAPDAATAALMRDRCTEAGVILAEAWMTPFDVRWSATLDLARSGRLGEITAVDGIFTFTIPADAADNYRWDPRQGGGALLDVGIYCLGPAVELWGADPHEVTASARFVSTGRYGAVDAATVASVGWGGGRVATLRCSFVDPEVQRLTIAGTRATVTLDGDAHTGGMNATRIDVVTSDGARSVIEVVPTDPYTGMIDAFSLAVRRRMPWPRPVEASVELLSLLDRIHSVTTGNDRP